ncbi:ABC transporter ATP-binding protein [Jonesia quinghaiensis]|uniref:ABC transporter ATP-binding protein n=1 Tax=Jonesia quinghaiensis TaxID=262806 RepID=UPI000406051D|nr:ATP-binding cassette domain-containing protein [Jonesia quinghaiensis]
MPNQQVTLGCDALAFRYARNAPNIFSGLTLTFRPGSVTALSGASGSGKSTLLYVLSLLLKPSAGSVTLNDQPVSQLDDATLSRIRGSHMGFIFQDAMLDPARTVLDNVCEAGVFAGLTRKESRAQAAALLEEFGVEHRIDHRPGEISGGQAQRVGLCRGLLTNPGLIFADEPTGNLDTDTSEVVWQALQTRARRGATVVIATHDPDLMKRADALHRIGGGAS